MSICQYSKPLKRLGGGQKEDLIRRTFLKYTSLTLLYRNDLLLRYSQYTYNNDYSFI